MVVSHVEYVGFSSGKTTRDYCLRIRRPDGASEEFTVAIRLEAFLANRVRYQDAAEISFLKLRRVLDAWLALPDSPPIERRHEITDAELLEYRQAHAPRAPQRKAPRPQA